MSKFKIPDDRSREQVSMVGEWSDRGFSEQKVRKDDAGETKQHTRQPTGQRMLARKCRTVASRCRTSWKRNIKSNKYDIVILIKCSFDVPRFPCFVPIIKSVNGSDLLAQCLVGKRPLHPIHCPSSYLNATSMENKTVSESSLPYLKSSSGTLQRPHTIYR